MRKLFGIGVVVLMLLMGGFWAVNQVGRRFNPFANMKPGVIQTTMPLSLADALIRSDCPISLPKTATNIQYAVWSLWQASQTFVRFEAPFSDCLEHAGTILDQYLQRPGISVSTNNVVGPIPMPVVVSPKDLTIAWFDLDRFATGVQFQVSGGRAPTVWVDTNRGCFYYALNE